MKGKPQTGYGATRHLTRREAEITGLTQSEIIFHEAGTGIISFWNAHNGGLNRALNNTERVEAEKILNGFWNT